MNVYIAKGGKFALYIFSAILILLLLLMFYPVEIQAHFRRKSKDDLLVLKVIIIPNLWIHRIEVPLFELEGGKIPSLKVKTEVEGPGKGTMLDSKGKLDFSPEFIRHVLHNIIPYYKLISCYFKSAKFFLKPWVIKSFSWKTCFGTGDAAVTGIASGLIWSAKYFFWKELTSIFKVKIRPLINVFPDFNRSKLEVEIDGIFASSLGNIIIASIQAWLKLRACRRKG